jgi:tyrosyl-tRNA synthetase
MLAFRTSRCVGGRSRCQFLTNVIPKRSLCSDRGDIDVDEPDSVVSVPVAETKIRSTLLKELVGRGYVYQCTDLVSLDRKLFAFEQFRRAGSVSGTVESANHSAAPPRPVWMYVGFDATAPALHAGSLIQLMLARTFLKHGHTVVCLLGGGTTKIGDPSGKDAARQMLSTENIQTNCDSISTVFSSVLGDESLGTAASTSGAGNFVIRNNSEWLDSLNYIGFLRDFGSQFSVNRMLSLESVKQRLNREQPLSFLEFNYSILQAFDFYHLFKQEGVELQIGGSDQWGNIVRYHSLL